jgi:hypothetical protein
VTCALRRNPTESSSEPIAARDSCKNGYARVTAGASHARLLGESAVWKVVSYGGVMSGAGSSGKPRFGRSLTLPLSFALPAPRLSALCPYPSHPDPVPYCFGRSLLQIGFRHQTVKVGRHSPKKLERGRKFSGTDSDPYFGRDVGQLSDRFGKGSRLGNGALLVD